MKIEYVPMNKRFLIFVIECLFDDVGWDINRVCNSKSDLQEQLKDVYTEFKKDRVRVRKYIPSSKV